MQKTSEANLVQALEFEGEVRAWLQGALLDSDQIEEVVLAVHTKWLEPAPSRMRRATVRRQTFLYARQFALLQARGRSDSEQAALAECLRRVPQFAPVWDDGLSGIQRQLKAVKALPGRCYEVFELYKATGCTQEQIAAQLSMTVEEVLVALAAAARAWAKSYSGQAQRATYDTVWELSEPAEITIGLQPLLN